VRPRDILFHIKKAAEGPYWARLIKDKALEKTFVSTDWSRYVDEDEATKGFDDDSFGAGASVSARAPPPPPLL
jgi:hypothetical protein